MRHLLMGNFKFKILALLLAILAWIYVHAVPYPSYINMGWRNQERNLNMSVLYENLEPGLRLAEKTEFVELVLLEESHTFMANEPVQAFVDLRGITTAGRYFMEIQVEKPGWMKLINQRPKYALITVEEVK